jgi:hypothetical protein
MSRLFYTSLPPVFKLFGTVCTFMRNAWLKQAQGDETSPSTGRRGGGIVFEKNQFNTIPYF